MDFSIERDDTFEWHVLTLMDACYAIHVYLEAVINFPVDARRSMLVSIITLDA